MIHYRIKLIGDYRVPQKPWLNITMSGYSFESEGYAHKFDSIAKANEWLNHLKACGKKVYMTWHDTSANPKHGAWGEVNRDVLNDMNPTFFEPWK